MEGEQMKEHVFVGLPCYNRPEGLKDAIRCLQNQTHPNWTVLISDNCSPNPAVRQVAEAACAADSRIQYLRHAKNLGAVENFHRLVVNCQSEFFMWTSDDDQLCPGFMAANLRLLRENPQAQMSAASISVINSAGDELFQCPGFSRFTTKGDLFEDALNYVRDPEKLGKASLIYGLYRTSAIQAVIEECWDECFSQYFGSDFLLNYAFICRHPIVATDEILLKKRQPTNATRRIHWRHPRSYRIAPAADVESYVERYRRISPTRELADAAEAILRQRQNHRFLYLLPFIGNLIAPRYERFRKAS